MQILILEYLYAILLLDLIERNLNHIILSYYPLPVGCKNLVDWYGSLGNGKLHFFLIYNS